MTETEIIFAKIGQLEKLLQILYVEKFEALDKPIKAAGEFSELIIKTEGPRSPDVSQEASLLMSESLHAFADRVIADLRRRGHQA